MRALRVVGITEGGDVVLEDSGRRERFTVPADEQLRAAARGDLTRLGQIAIELESQLRPREIQARIRAGASVEQVASAAGVPIQKIERFAYPVLLERSRTAEVAQRAHPVRADGPDVRTLGDVVAHTFGLRGQEYTEAEWDSWKGEDGKWLVALSWRAGRSDNRAHWTFQPGAHGGTVSAVDEHASDLVEGLPARPLRPVGPVIDIARPEELPPPAQPPTELRATGSDAGRERSPEYRSPEPWMPERRAPVERTPAADRTPDRTVTDRAGTIEREAADRPAPERTPADAAPVADRAVPSRTVPDRPAPDRPVAEPAPQAPATQAPATQTPATQTPATEQVPAAQAPTPEPAAPEHPAAEQPSPVSGPPVTEPPAAEPEPAAAPPAQRQAETPTEPAPRRTKKGKPVMPSWDEVLLGVRGQR
ncbi:septation protein SepH [Pseudonocardia saturnea]